MEFLTAANQNIHTRPPSHLVDTRDWHAHRGADRPLRHAAECVQHVVKRGHMEFLTAANQNIHTRPPSHLVRLLQEVVAHPARYGKDRRVLLNEVLLPTNLDQHALHLVGDFVIPILLVASGVAIHLVYSDADPLHAQQVDQSRVLASLALDLTSLMVSPRNRSREVTVGWHHNQRNVCLRCTRDHVLDEVAVTWSINDGVMPLFSEEFLRGACNGHATLTFLFLAVHVEGEGERALAQTLRLRLQLLKLTLWDTTQFEKQAACGRAFAAVDMAADHDGKVLFLRRHGYLC